MTVGATIFVLYGDVTAKHTKGKSEKETTLMGMLLMLGYLGFDGFTSTFQDKVRSLTRSLARSLTDSLTRCLADSLTHSLAHSLTFLWVTSSSRGTRWRRITRCCT